MDYFKSRETLNYMTEADLKCREAIRNHQIDLAQLYATAHHKLLQSRTDMQANVAMNDYLTLCRLIKESDEYINS